MSSIICHFFPGQRGEAGLWMVCYQPGYPVYIVSRPGRSQGLLYKQPRDYLSQSVSQPFPPTALRRRHAQRVRDGSSSYKNRLCYSDQEISKS